ncbi:branched chain aminotransferase 1, cytosolic [Trichuris trichiura]|uniref:Branched-chain-amino-acid aminotransferase n=1 Tax=Trichuris trichiura TaxID=36087 RepID=A0A077ZHW0_TRITR|nr:branched chain aminotransferase 1, cytosolic [Trichuris trichiura]
MRRDILSRNESHLNAFAFRIFKLQYKDLKKVIVPPDERKQKKPFSEVRFGEDFSDHMFEVEWTSRDGWGKPKICPFHDLVLHPASKVLHYACQIFEGLKAFRGIDGKIRLFRPRLNVQRMLRSAQRCSMPNFDAEEFLNCLVEFVRIEKDWIPEDPSGSFYIRPTMIATEPTVGISIPNSSLLYIIAGPVGSYWGSGTSKLNPVALYADPSAVRAWYGGAGNAKMGSNYAPTLYHLAAAHKHGCSQNLWLFGPEEIITEVGAMNLFVYWINEKGDKELITAPLDGLILPGVTRQTIIELAKEWVIKVRDQPLFLTLLISIPFLVIEIFGSGTAVIVSPINKIIYKKGDTCTTHEIPTMKHAELSQRCFKAITDIQVSSTVL